MDGAGISALVPTVGLGALPDPMGDATALLEARRRQQIEGAGYDPDKGLYDRYSAMLGTVFGPTINERAVAAREAMRRGDMATANALNQSLALDFGQFLGSIKPIRAYHGSPHDFDRFDMSKIGTGEGAQAYGHGLYFAENEGVARSYRDKLSPPRVNVDGVHVPADGRGPQNQAIRYVQKHHGNVDDALRELRHWGGKDKYRRAAAEWLHSNKGRISSEPSGRMYEVNIHADPERFLDLDKPLSQQTQAVRDAAMKAVAQGAADAARAAGISGTDVAAGIANSANPFGMFPNAVKGSVMSGAMRNAGIPGIKYLDQGSRAAGDGSRNYVVFDDKLIEILRKYGIMAPMAGAGVGSLYMDGEGEGM